MEIDDKIMEYLYEYGNTKESDLIHYLERESALSDRQIKKILERMEKANTVFRVVHDKLKPPGVYIALNPKTIALYQNEQFPKTMQALDESTAELFRKKE